MTRTDTRTRVLKAARSVFARIGYKATTVEDILKEAHVARGTFYRYFPNKRQVFFDLMSELLDGIYEAARPLTTGDSEALSGLIHDSFAQCYRLFIDNRGVFLTFIREGLTSDVRLFALWDDFDRRMNSVFTVVLERGALSGEFRTLDSDLVSRAMMMLFLQVPYRDIMPGGRAQIDVDSLAGEMAGFVLEGLGARQDFREH
ncbi:MAG TPA: TetR/AcrR family transcriptional regulator [Candidatus Anoxymicrobiaceae bacterium]